VVSRPHPRSHLRGGLPKARRRQGLSGRRWQLRCQPPSPYWKRTTRPPLRCSAKRPRSHRGCGSRGAAAPAPVAAVAIFGAGRVRDDPAREPPGEAAGHQPGCHVVRRDPGGDRAPKGRPSAALASRRPPTASGILAVMTSRPSAPEAAGSLRQSVSQSGIVRKPSRSVRSRGARSISAWLCAFRRSPSSPGGWSVGCGRSPESGRR
jgi:hypothetical protein